MGPWCSHQQPRAHGGRAVSRALIGHDPCEGDREVELAAFEMGFELAHWAVGADHYERMFAGVSVLIVAATHWR